jgi:hypothetical protein
MRHAAAQQQYERAASLRRRSGRLGAILRRIEGVLEATHVRPRLLYATHPLGHGGDVFWLVGGRLVDYGALPEEPQELEQRTATALIRRGRPGDMGALVPPDEVDEVRIMGSYLASHPDTAQLDLDPIPDLDRLDAFLAAARGLSETAALSPSR